MKNIFQVWAGEPPEKNIIDMMQKNCSKAIDYTLIAETNFLNVNTFIDIKEYTKNNLHLNYCEFNSTPFKRVLLVDLLRFSFLAEAESAVLYLDCDALFVKDFNLPEGSYFVSSAEAEFDFYAIYSNKGKSFFKPFFTFLLESYMYFKDIKYFSGSQIKAFLIKRRRFFKLFSSDCIEHLNAQSWKNGHDIH